MIYFYLIVCIACLFFNAFFAASEISLVSSNLLRLRHKQNKGDEKAKKAYKMISKPEKFLATNLIGTNIFIILSANLFTSFLIKIGVGKSNLWTTLVFAPLVIIFSELVPKNIGRFLREDFSIMAVDILRFFEKLFLPIVNAIESLSKFLIKVFAKEARYRSFFVTKEEIKSLIREIEKQGGIDKGEKEAIEEVFEFRSDKVKDYCVLTKKIAGFDYTDSYKKVLETVKNNRFTRYPVFKDKEIIGFINVYDLFYQGAINWQKLIRPLTVVGLNQKLHEVFTLLKSKRESIALVLKGNKAYGIISIQDIIREIITSIVKV